MCLKIAWKLNIKWTGLTEIENHNGHVYGCVCWLALYLFVLQLKQMRRDVELSRRRSIKLKAQVDKLQEQSQDGLVWSQHRQRVRQEVQAPQNTYQLFNYLSLKLLQNKKSSSMNIQIKEVPKHSPPDTHGVILCRIYDTVSCLSRLQYYFPFKECKKKKKTQPTK